MIERISLVKVKSSEALVLDMVSTPNFVLKSVDWDTVRGTHHSYKYVSQVGASITNTTLGMRQVTIEGWVVADTESKMTFLKGRLNAYVNPQEVIELHYSDYKIRFHPDESVRYSVSYPENNELFAKFQITGTCPNPLFSEIDERKETFVTTAPAFRFPLVMAPASEDKGVVFGKRSNSLLVKVHNKGSVQVGMKLVFKATGTVVNPRVTNIGTQEEFLVNKTLVSGEEIIINTNIGEKSLRGRVGGGDYVNYYQYKDLFSSWLKLDVGDNLFSYGAESGIDNLDVFVYFTNQFLEVQECY